MKKVFTIVAIILSIAIATPMADAIPSTSTSSTQTTGTKVTIVSFRGHVKITNSALVNSNGDYLSVTFGGETYTARSSNRSGYDWMFTTNTTTWYFNY